MLLSMPAFNIDLQMKKESIINTGESRRLLDSAVDSSREGSPEVVLNGLEITV